MAKQPKLSPSRIRPPLREGGPRRFAPVDETDPDRIRLVAIVDLQKKSSALWEKACADFVEENIGLAVSYAQGLSSGRTPSEDLKHAAALGLMRAIRRFDYTKAGKFSTYAVWWMRHECNQVLYRDEAPDGIPIPGQLREDRRELEAALQALSHSLKREPTDSELSAVLSLPPPEEDDGPDPSRWTEERVRFVRQVNLNPRSKPLDPKRASGGGGDVDVRLDVRRLITLLPDYLRAVLAEEYGLGDLRPDLVPQNPAARDIALDLAHRKIRRLMEKR